VTPSQKPAARPSAAERIDRWRRYRRFAELAPALPVAGCWSPSGTRFAAITDSVRIRLFDIAGAQDDHAIEVLEFAAWADALRAAGVTGTASVADFSSVQWADDETLRFQIGDRIVDWDVDRASVGDLAGVDPRQALKASRAVRPPDIDDWPSASEIPSPDGEWMLTELMQDLAVRSTRDDNVRVLTEGGTPSWSWRVDGASWSPRSDRVFAIRNDYRGVPALPVVDYLADAEHVRLLHPYAKTRYWPVPRSFHLIDAPSGRGRELILGLGAGAIVTVLGWRGDQLFLHALDAEATTQKVLEVDGATGAVRVVLSEAATISTAMFFRRRVARSTGFSLDAGDGRFFWSSERSGYNQWYIHDLETGEELVQLTSGEYDAEELIAVLPGDPARVLFCAHTDADRPFDIRACSAAIDGTDQQVITPEQGDHAIHISPSGSAFLDTWSSPTTTPQVRIRAADGQVIADLTPGADGFDPDWIAPLEFTALSPDGSTTLHGVLYLPPGFDPTRRYPLVDVIYGGCQIPVRPTRFDQSGGSVTLDGEPPRHGAHAQAIAQLGFVTMVIDGRGTPGRGSAFQGVVRGQMGSVEIPEHAAAIRELIERHSWIDGARVGITGRSWGGYLAVRAMLLEPELFSVAVAEAPGADHYDSIGHLSYIIMGDPATHAAEYDAGSSLLIADRLAGRLLITHGSSDLSASLSGTMKLVDAFIKEGRPVDMFLIPGATHYPKGQAGHYSDALAVRYLIEHLQPEGIEAADIPFS
jgi:dipeptidyl aminopeptidase/acylaminoacyl peptidase